jgi:hypothetical protein
MVAQKEQKHKSYTSATIMHGTVHVDILGKCTKMTPPHPFVLEVFLQRLRPCYVEKQAV